MEFYHSSDDVIFWALLAYVSQANFGVLNDINCNLGVSLGKCKSLLTICLYICNSLHS
jgi:hypothetical protein